MTGLETTMVLVFAFIMVGFGFIIGKQSRPNEKLNSNYGNLNDVKFEVKKIETAYLRKPNENVYNDKIAEYTLINCYRAGKNNYVYNTFKIYAEPNKYKIGEKLIIQVNKINDLAGSGKA